jgi:serine/threonine protein phosphatase 1
MLSLLSKAAPKPTVAKSTGGRVAYAVGDVHGRLDLLRRLVGIISDDHARVASDDRPLLIFLGDYVDRGDDPRGVIDLVLALAQHSAFEVRCLKGNHEEALLQFLADPTSGPVWAQHGGASTLLSYGVQPPADRLNPDGWEETRQALAVALPAEHLAFFQGLELSLCLGDYMFVHAGVRHGVDLAEQSEHDLLWIRRPFLEEKRPFDKMIVHGHTPSEQPFVGANRIGVDTGAYATGVLSAVRLCGADRAFLSTGAH